MQSSSFVDRGCPTNSTLVLYFPTLEIIFSMTPLTVLSPNCIYKRFLLNKVTFRVSRKMRWNPLPLMCKTNFEKLSFPLLKLKRKSHRWNCMESSNSSIKQITLQRFARSERYAAKFDGRTFRKLLQFFIRYELTRCYVWSDARKNIKKFLLQHKNTNKNFVVFFRTAKFQGMRFRVQLAAPSHKRILFQVLAGFDVFTAI